MQGSDLEGSSEESFAAEPGGDHPATAPANGEELLLERVEPLSEHEGLLAKVHRLEAELERYRVHAERTSKLFFSVTHYAEWIREGARREAELALRKARARAEKLTVAADELEETERKLVRQKAELARLQVLTDETRARLSAFLTAGLQVLNAEVETARADSPEPALDELDDTLRRQLVPTSPPEPVLREEVETEEH